jgi:CheY-like chemotaxis protein
MRVLVVDDNATNRRILHEVLQGWSMRPTVVDGAAAALVELRQAASAGEPYPLVLLDAHMPETDGFTLAAQIKQSPALNSAILVMLTSAGRSGDVTRCEQLGINAYLMKPIKQSDLLGTLLDAFDKVRLYARSTPSVAPTPATPRRLRVLLVEDNVINQKLGLRLLEKHGHSVQVAGNGRECLQVLEREDFDLILMDVQMPEMDGLEATRLIRSGEEGTGRHIPILAMTAHAMKGDRELCLAAGMDGYLTKPIQPQELYQNVDKLFSAHEPSNGAGQRAKGPVTEAR